jgi:hypothetical protein
MRENLNRFDLTFPKLEDIALEGILGDISKRAVIDAEPSAGAVLVHLLVGIGNIIGRLRFTPVKATLHYPNLFAAIVGRTSRGGKGETWEIARWFLRQIDLYWSGTCLMEGEATTSAGIINSIRDAEPESTRPRKGHIRDEGVSDKRLCIVEEEFGKVLRLMKREGDYLSHTLRQCYDSKPLGSRTKESPYRVAEPHVSLLAQITPAEFIDLVSVLDVKAGFLNRFLVCLVRREKTVSSPSPLAEKDFAEDIDAIKRSINNLNPMHLSPPSMAAKVIGRTKKAEALWDKLYREYKREDSWEDYISRGAPMVVRISMIYAILDGSDIVKIQHLRRADAVWKYSCESLKFIFSPNTLSQKEENILNTIIVNGQISKTEITRDIFSGNLKINEMEPSITKLLNGSYMKEGREGKTIIFTPGERIKSRVNTGDYIS